MVKVHWWRGGRGHGNFGDVLAPRLCEHLSGQQVEYAEPHRADILAVGSVLEPHLWTPGTWQHYRGAIWGAGRMFGGQPMPFPEARVLAVRGWLTLRKLDFRDKDLAVVGDPGLLCHLFARDLSKKHKLGLIPHWSESGHPLVARLASRSPDITVIDICAPFQDVIDQVSQCEYILSSALHGLVLADALNIPNEWLRLHSGKENAMGLPEFKYRDYYSIYGLEKKSYVELSRDDTLDAVLARFGRYSRPGLRTIQRDLLEAFPFGKR